MTFKNGLRFTIIMILTMCTAFYIVPIPESMIYKIVFSAIWVIIIIFYIRKREYEKKVIH